MAVTAPLPPQLAAQVHTPELYSSALFGAEAVQNASRAAAAAAATGGGSAAAAAASASALAGSSASGVAAAALPPGATPFFRPLDDNDRQRALFFLVALPWAKGRADALYVRWRDGVDETGFEEAPYDPQHHNPLYNVARRVFMRVYPLFHAGFEGAQLIAQLRFLFEASVFASPWLYAQAQVVRRMTMEDMAGPPAEAAARALAPVARGALESAWPRSWPMRVLFFLRSFARACGRFVGRYAKYGVLLSIFAFKFLEWWHSPANAYYSAGGGGSSRRLPVPPPPKQPLPVEGGVALPADRSLCPLCLDERANPAATPTGYVFCYSCIHQHVQARHCCPITLRPCTLQQLRKIYDS